jgi:hypothetical protein
MNMNRIINVNDDNSRVFCDLTDRLCGPLARVLITDPEVPGSIPGATRFSET